MSERVFELRRSGGFSREYPESWYRQQDYPLDEWIRTGRCVEVERVERVERRNSELDVDEWGAVEKNICVDLTPPQKLAFDEIDAAAPRRPRLRRASTIHLTRLLWDYIEDSPERLWITTDRRRIKQHQRLPTSLVRLLNRRAESSGVRRIDVIRHALQRLDDTVPLAEFHYSSESKTCQGVELTPEHRDLLRNADVRIDYYYARSGIAALVELCVSDYVRRVDNGLLPPPTDRPPVGQKRGVWIARDVISEAQRCAEMFHVKRASVVRCALDHLEDYV